MKVYLVCRQRPPQMEPQHLDELQEAHPGEYHGELLEEKLSVP